MNSFIAFPVSIFFIFEIESVFENYDRPYQRTSAACSQRKELRFFYRDKLGFELGELSENEAYLTIGKGASWLALKSIDVVSNDISKERIRPEEETDIKRSHYVVFVEDLDKEYEDLKGKQVHFMNVPKTLGDGWRVVHFEDPERNLWEIAQAPKK